MQEFAIRHDPWYKWIAVLCGLVPQWSRLTIDGDQIVVRMSYAFRSTFDRSAIRSVTCGVAMTTSRMPACSRPRAPA